MSIIRVWSGFLGKTARWTAWLPFMCVSYRNGFAKKKKKKKKGSLACDDRRQDNCFVQNRAIVCLPFAYRVALCDLVPLPCCTFFLLLLFILYSKPLLQTVFVAFWVLALTLTNWTVLYLCMLFFSVLLWLPCGTWNITGSTRNVLAPWEEEEEAAFCLPSVSSSCL
jgi:hypothetical protein